MSKIKLRKSELKIQKDYLKKYERFLPILQLKKQQLQMEVIKINRLMREAIIKQSELKKHMEDWVSLFGYQDEFDSLKELIEVEEVITDSNSIAGIEVPVYVDTKFRVGKCDSFCTPLWIDEGIKSVCNLMMINIMLRILEQQSKIVNEELRLATQRVNLFEKVKIPECKENIRVIQIYLSDQQIASICNSKMAKKISTVEGE